MYSNPTRTTTRTQMHKRMHLSVHTHTHTDPDTYPHTHTHTHTQKSMLWITLRLRGRVLKGASHRVGCALRWPSVLFPAQLPVHREALPVLSSQFTVKRSQFSAPSSPWSPDALWVPLHICFHGTCWWIQQNIPLAPVHSEPRTSLGPRWVQRLNARNSAFVPERSDSIFRDFREFPKR